MDGFVAGCFGAGEVDEVEEAVVGGGEGGVLEADAADGVGAGGAVVLEGRGGAADGGGGFYVGEEGLFVADAVFECAGHLSGAQGVFEDGDLLARVEEI